MNSPADKEREVVIVLSDEFVETLSDLALEHHVWALRTVRAEGVAREFWKAHPPGHRQVSSGGITLFTGKGDPEADFLASLDDVELHHGITAREGIATNTLRVLGVEASEMIRDALYALGFTQIEPTPGGFVARWHRE